MARRGTIAVMSSSPRPRPSLARWPGPGRRPRGGALGLALVALLAALAPGCGVQRPARSTLPPAAALPNLRRAGAALQDRILLESNHVESLNDRLLSLRSREERLWQDVLEAEDSYHRLESDYDGVAGDVAAVQEELAAVRADLVAVQGELQGAQAELGARQGELGGVRDQATEVEAELANARAQLELAQQEADALAADVARLADGAAQRAEARVAWIERLEVYRQAYGVSPDDWQGLLEELGLTRLDEELALPGSETAAGPDDAPAIQPAAAPDGAGADGAGEPEEAADESVDPPAQPEGDAPVPGPTEDDAETPEAAPGEPAVLAPEGDPPSADEPPPSEGAAPDADAPTGADPGA